MRAGPARSAVIVMALMTVISACMNVGTGTSLTTRFYLLEPKIVASPSPNMQKEAAKPAIGMGPVTIPPYLDRPQMVTRVSEQELVADDFNYWAEPLKANISRVMGENLLPLIGGGHIRYYPWNRSAAIDFQIAMDVLRFDGDTTGKVKLKVVWRIVDPDDQRLLIERQSTIEQASTGTDIADRVEAMSMTLADLSRKIADDCLKLTATQ